MLKTLAAFSAMAITMLPPGLAHAQVYNFTISTTQDNASGQFTLGSPEGANTVTSVTGTVNGNAITGLSGYGGADQQLFNTSPYADRAGIGFTDGTLMFNIFDNYTGPSGNPVYSFCNSMYNGGCTGGAANGAPVATFTISRAGAAVPEPATWAMMLLGFGMIGFGLRYRRKSAKVSFA